MVVVLGPRPQTTHSPRLVRQRAMESVAAVSIRINKTVCSNIRPALLGSRHSGSPLRTAIVNAVFGVATIWNVVSSGLPTESRRTRKRTGPCMPACLIRSLYQNVGGGTGFALEHATSAKSPTEASLIMLGARRLGT